MERTSLITSLQVAFAASSSNIHLVKGLPDSTSLSEYFTPCPFVTEKAELTEETETTEQGQLLKSSIRANIHRDESFHGQFAFAHLLIYMVLVNGERIYLGTPDNPVMMEYTRKSGAGISDSNETSLIFSHIQAV